MWFNLLALLIPIHRIHCWLTCKNKRKGSLEGRHMYLFCCYVLSYSESIEISHADSFSVKKCPFFFPQVGKQSFKHVLVSPSVPTPPPPFPPTVGMVLQHMHSIYFSRIEILHCLETERGISATFCPYFSSCFTMCTNIFAYKEIYSR